MPRQRFLYPDQFREDEPGAVLIRFRDVPEALTAGDADADAGWQAADCLAEAAVASILAGRDQPSRARYPITAIYPCYTSGHRMRLI